ncbi:GDSL-type esterase/lipase family protein [Tolumonas lignilytica]|uniref:GDSL-type esterase/lipase family protein n=1 Tax=Tolumonas lignilytica TaxID=1283284 RepID=UPI0009E038F3|nr:GDSL-type esterase/lipase family protein [Tolumonas lignilytica]
MLLSVFSLSGHAGTLLILGDSLSAGYMMAAEQSWPVLLDQQWQKAHFPVSIINSSISGSTSQDGLARLPALLSNHKPNWVLIELGANDGIRGFPPQVPYQTLKKIIQLIQKSGAKPLLMQIRIPRNYGAAYIAKLESIYPQLAQEMHTPLLPFFLEPIVIHPELMLNDGIHPKAEAQPLIRDMMEPLLRQYIKPSATTP